MRRRAHGYGSNGDANAYHNRTADSRQT